MPLITKRRATPLSLFVFTISLLLLHSNGKESLISLGKEIIFLSYCLLLFPLPVSQSLNVYKNKTVLLKFLKLVNVQIIFHFNSYN